MLTYEQLSQRKIIRKKTGLKATNGQKKKKPTDSEHPMDRMGIGVWLKALLS